MSTRLLLADDNALVRQGLRAFLERQGFDVTCEAANGREALQMANKTQPEVAIIDISMPLLNGIDAAREFKKSAPKTKVILLTKHGEDHYVTEALKAGACGYVLKSQVATDLMRAIEEVRRGSVYLSPAVSRAVVGAYLLRAETATDPLSVRERQILQLVGEGKSTKQVALQLRVSVKTAEFHRARLMRKLDIQETAGLVRYAIRHGPIQAKN